MKAEQSGSTAKPLSINEDFFEGLKAILSDFEEAILRAAAEKHGLPIASVKAALASEEAIPISYDAPDTSSLEAIEKHYEDIRKREKTSRMVNDIRSDLSVKYQVAFVNSFSINVDSIKQLVEVISRETVRPDTLTVRAGLSYFAPSMTLSLSNAVKAARYEVQGDRTDVDCLSRRIKSLLDASPPAHPMLHGNVLKILLSAFVSTYGSIGLLQILFEALPPISVSSGNAILIWIASMAALSWPMMFGLTKLWESSFPRCQFEYGPDWRRLKSRRTVMLLIFTALILPTARSLILHQT